MKPSFPFSALVGQDSLKQALLLAVIQPSLGGVLIRGTKGVAKSTAVRALAALLPPIEVVVGCPFQRAPGDDIPDWPLPQDAATTKRPLPLIELPLGTTEDRLLGTLHLEKALRGERAFEPGLLAAANRGILYVDEVNLLADHLVDVLLDAAASGWHRVEREGLSLGHPARFVLIGTMNPEEGELRPQLLDRFGLVVDSADLTEASDRAEVVRRRLAYEADPSAFADAWSQANAAEAERIVRAQHLLPQVQIADPLVNRITERCLTAGVQGLRADLTWSKAASAWAAYQGRTQVEPADLEAVAELALAHRRTRPSEPPPPRGSMPVDGEPRTKESSSQPPPIGERGGVSPPVGERGGVSPPVPALTQPRSPSSILLPSTGLFAPRPRPPRQMIARSLVAGRWRKGATKRLGPITSPFRLYSASGSTVAWAATLRAAALYQADRRREAANAPILLRPADLRTWSHRGPAGYLLLFVIDGSGSMAARKRMRQTKSAVLALLVRAYQRRDRVAFLVFRGTRAEMVLAPTRGLRTARRVLEELAVGGTTPLAHGLMAAGRLIHHYQRRQSRQPIWTILLTDGRANVSANGGDPWHDALAQARMLRSSGGEFLVVDTETGWPRFHRAVELAHFLGAPCYPVDDVLGQPLPDWHGLPAAG
jgi:magnesium chelatase subunit D